MISDTELQRVLEAQPLSRMRWFASLLGWNGLQLDHVRLTDTVVIFYMTTDEKFNLQINTFPHGQCRLHQATVKAERYRIINVGLHDFELLEDDQSLFAEAERLKPWLYRSQFKKREWCRQFIKAHPKMAYPFSKRKRGR